MENKNGRSCDLCLEREKDIEAETPSVAIVFPFICHELLGPDAMILAF